MILLLLLSPVKYLNVVDLKHYSKYTTELQAKFPLFIKRYRVEKYFSINPNFKAEKSYKKGVRNRKKSVIIPYFSFYYLKPSLAPCPISMCCLYHYDLKT